MSEIAILSVAALAMLAGPAARNPGTVVFVCEHGNVKSLIAREWFNRLAAARGLAVRAVARGVTPDGAVPVAVAASLRQDGFDVSGFEARALSVAEANDAVRVVAIGTELPFLPKLRAAAVDRWEGIPPASERYADSRDAMRLRIEALLVSLEQAQPSR